MIHDDRRKTSGSDRNAEGEEDFQEQRDAEELRQLEYNVDFGGGTAPDEHPVECRAVPVADQHFEAHQRQSSQQDEGGLTQQVFINKIDPELVVEVLQLMGVYRHVRDSAFPKAGCWRR